MNSGAPGEPVTAAAGGSVSGQRESRGQREFAAAAIAIAAGGGLALLASARAWDVVTVSRAAPLGPLAVAVDGRTIVPGVAGLAVVALAGVLALLATRGRARAAVGAILTLAGVLLAWQAATGIAAISPVRGRVLVAQARTGVVLAGDQSVAIRTAPQWPALALLGAALVVTGGVLITVRGGGWLSMSARYDSPTGLAKAGGLAQPTERIDPLDEDARRAKADLAMWHSLERGEDPTVDSEPHGGH